MGEKKDRVVELQLDNTAFTGFRIDGTVHKTLAGEPDRANIQIYGLGRTTTAALLERNRDVRIRFLAGYKLPRLIFQGHPINDGITFKRDDNDRVLGIEAQDGIIAYQKSRVNFSVEGPITYGQLVDEVIRQGGLSRQSLGGLQIPNEDKQVDTGLYLEGRTATILDELADTLNCQWSIQSDEVLFLPRDRAKADKGYEFNPELGNLIGSPEPMDGGLSIRVLLEDIEPGDRFMLQGIENKRYVGLYRADSVTYQISSGFDAPFYCQIEATPLPMA